MGKEIVTKVQEMQKLRQDINPRMSMTRHIVIKFTKIKDKEKISKAMRQK